MIMIRPYTTQDSTQLSHAINQVCVDTPWMATQGFVPTNAWLHAMEMDDCYCHRLLIAENYGDIIGWCRSFPVDCKAPPFHAELGIGLLPKYRNQGIGSELITRSLQWAKTVELKTVDLTVSAQNSIAVHVFTKCGFEPVNTYDNKMCMSACLS